jgi:imidazolonepropionase-like amidohydrolase
MIGLAAAGVWLLAAGAPAPPALAIRGVTVVDVAGGPSLAGMTVVITGDRITALGPEAVVPPGARVVDGQGRYLIPGLWDMHMHLTYTKTAALPALIANGVTGVRDLGGLLREIDEWRTAIELGRLVGPRIVRAGPQVNGKAFNFHQLAVADAAEARAAVRALHLAGVDLIKIHRATSREAFFAIMTEAKWLKIPVSGHISRTVTPEEASDAGQASFDHVDTLFEGTFATKVGEGNLGEAIARFRAEEAPALFARLARNGTAVTPVLSVIEGAQDIDAMLADPRQKYSSAYSRRITVALAERSRPSRTPESVAGDRRYFEELLAVVRLLRDAGVTLMTGTDVASAVVFPGFSVHDEMALLVRAGLTPLEALQAGTRNPARFLKRADLGTVEVGRLADLVLLDADPLQDIRNTQRIHAVVVNGKLFDRPALDGLLAEAARRAAAPED